MDCEELLVEQASATKGANGSAFGWVFMRNKKLFISKHWQTAYDANTRVFVYRNFVKALPWYTSVREKISDPAYAGWFLRFGVSCLGG
jgi:hypothetical protein